MFSDTFAGIAPASVPGYVVAQLVGGIVAIVVLRTLYPDVTPAEAADVVHAPPRRLRATFATRAVSDRRRAVTHIVAIGGSDAGISAALRARELDPACEFTVVVADAYPNFSICGIPYYVSGEVTHWRNLAHRTTADLEATGMQLRLDTLATQHRPRRTHLTPGPRRRARRRSPTTR